MNYVVSVDSNIKDVILKNSGIKQWVYIGEDYENYKLIKSKLPDSLPYYCIRKKINNIALRYSEKIKKSMSLACASYSKKKRLCIHGSQLQFYIVKSARNLILYFTFLSLVEEDNLENTLFVVEDKKIYNKISQHNKNVNPVLPKRSNIEDKFKKITKLFWNARYKDCLQYFRESQKKINFKRYKGLKNKNIVLLHAWVDENIVKKEFPLRHFYSDLEEYLQKQGYEVFYLVRILNKEKYLDIVSELNKKAKNFIIVDEILSAFDLIKICFEDLFWNTKDLSLNIDGEDLTSLLEMSEFVGNNFTSKEYLSFYYVFENFKKIGVNINKFIYIFENQNWEKMYLYAIKKFFPKAETTAFQHAQLPLYWVGYYPCEEMLELFPYPDKIICISDNSANILKAKWGNKTQVLNGPALRDSYFFDIYYNQNIFKGFSKEYIGIAGSIFKQPTKDLLEQIVNIVKQGIDTKFLIKLHPFTDISLFYSLLDKKVEIFNGSEEEFYQNIYGLISPGTSLMLKAELLGIKSFLYVAFNSLEESHIGHDCERIYSYDELVKSIKALKTNKFKFNKLFIEDFYNNITENALGVFN